VRGELQSAEAFSLRRFRSVLAVFLNHANERKSLNLSPRSSRECEPFSLMHGLLPTIILRPWSGTPLSRKVTFQAESHTVLGLSKYRDLYSTVDSRGVPSYCDNPGVERLQYAPQGYS
jgi:hypothetical protein